MLQIVDRKSPMSQIKPMSASDEKVVEQAIARANELSEESAHNSFLLSSPSPSDLGDLSLSPSSSGGSPSLLGMFSRNKKSPKQEKRSFADEIASLSSDLSEDVTIEGQEAYNELVAKSSSLERVRDSSEERRKHARERRARRALEHQQQTSSGLDLSSERERNNSGKARNQFIRAPVGIPTRGSRFGVQEEKPAEDNPLRRLRDSGSFLPSQRMTRSAIGELRDSNSSSSERLDVPSSQSMDSISKPYISSPSQISTRTSPSSQRNGYQVGQGDLSRKDHVSEGGFRDDDDPPLPPRRPLKPGTVNIKPRERKYQLDLCSGGQKDNTQTETLTAITTEQADNILNISHESGDSVFSESETSTHSGKAPDIQSQFCVKNVKLSAEDLGIKNRSDEFWVKEVNFEDQAHSEGDVDDIPMTGRYKTSDTVSYEDLLEFALDDSELER